MRWLPLRRSFRSAISLSNSPVLISADADRVAASNRNHRSDYANRDALTGCHMTQQPRRFCRRVFLEPIDWGHRDLRL
jgi:hypothetical protein